MAVSQVIIKSSGIELSQNVFKDACQNLPSKTKNFVSDFFKKMSDISLVEGKRAHLGD